MKTKNRRQSQNVEDQRNKPLQEKDPPIQAMNVGPRSLDDLSSSNRWLNDKMKARSRTRITEDTDREINLSISAKRLRQK